jgi:teichuronic acid biosynthesis glycosyltransferase TuaG
MKTIVNPLVSIIMPAYNSEKTIIESVRSVIAQTYINWELLIIDDASKIPVKIFEDTRIKVYRNTINKNVAFSRNKGINVACGSIVALLDSDDVWSNEKLEKQLNFMKRYNAKISYTACAYMASDGRKLKYILPATLRLTYRENLKQNLMSCSSVMCERGLLIKYPFPEKKKLLHEDFCSWIRILREVDYAYGLDEPLLTYRISNRSKSSNRIFSAIMTYNSFCEVGFNPLIGLALTIRYAIRSIRKRRRIKNT